ncbi:hypothetical protein TNCV_3963581 [Trichonephila clavipes]|nr:hypothetical protein TNCV_3963581 [Trichonephila clavipes]
MRVWNDRPTNSDTDRAFGGSLILIKKFINHFSLPNPLFQSIEATIVILTPLDQDPISINSALKTTVYGWCKEFLKNKRSDIPALNCPTGKAVTHDQKVNILANILANTIIPNFTENTRPNSNDDEDDAIINNTVNTFLYPTPTIIETANHSEIISSIKKFNSEEAPDKENISVTG